MPVLRLGPDRRAHPRRHRRRSRRGQEARAPRAGSRKATGRAHARRQRHVTHQGRQAGGPGTFNRLPRARRHHQRRADRPLAYNPAETPTRPPDAARRSTAGNRSKSQWWRRFLSLIPVPGDHRFPHREHVPRRSDSCANGPSNSSDLDRSATAIAEDPQLGPMDCRWAFPVPGAATSQAGHGPWCSRHIGHRNHHARDSVGTPGRPRGRTSIVSLYPQVPLPSQ